MTDTTTAEGVQTPDAPAQTAEQAQGAPDAPTGPDTHKETQSPQDAAETFPRAYVEKLRQEAAEARLKAKRADQWAEELFVARVAATGRLADPSDLPFDVGLVDNLPALEAAIDDLLGRKPHLAARTPRGSIGQGVSGAADTVDLAAILRRGA